MAKPSNFTRLRQILLFYVLLMVATSTWLSISRSTDWNNTLWVAIYPINGDGSSAVNAYIEQLEENNFDTVEDFFAEQIKLYGHTLKQPVNVKLLQPLNELPPALPAKPSTPRVMWWSLRMRYWAWRMERSQEKIPADIKMFMVYFDPQSQPRLAHSVGLQKGLFGVVNAYGAKAYRGSNQVVLSHEIMHTLGATDKYHLDNAYPIFPDGFADPTLEPRWPQSEAEIMGGRIAVSETEAEVPNTLKQVRVGQKTAREIRWVD